MTPVLPFASTRPKRRRSPRSGAAGRLIRAPSAAAVLALRAAGTDFASLTWSPLPQGLRPGAPIRFAGDAFDTFPVASDASPR